MNPLSPSPPFPHPRGACKSKFLRLPLQPLPRPLALVVAVEKRFRLLTDLGVIGVDPVELGRGEEGEVEETATERHHGDVLEAEVGLVPEAVLGVGFAGHDDVWSRGGEVSLFGGGGGGEGGQRLGSVLKRESGRGERESVVVRRDEKGGGGEKNVD